MAGIELSEVVNSFVAQSPLAGAAIWIAHFYMKKHEEVVAKLVATFEAEVRTCEERYKFVFTELMKLKDRVDGV